MRALISSALVGFALYYSVSAQDIEMDMDAAVGGAVDEQEYPLIHHASVGDVEGIRAELDKGMELNYRNVHGWTPLIFAVENGRDEIVDLLVESGADVNIQENDGWTALMFAGYHGDARMVDLLIDNGADALLTNGAGYAAHTIAHNREYYELASRIASAGVSQAIGSDDIDACIALIKEGADVNSQNDNGWTSLTLAAALNLEGETGYLIDDAHANLNWLENDGWSPLMFAANNNFLGVAEVLLSRGADILSASVSGVDALSLARDQGHGEMTALLEEYLSRQGQTPAVYDDSEAGAVSGGSGGEALAGAVEEAQAAVAAQAAAVEAPKSVVAEEAPKAAEPEKKAKKLGFW